MPFPVIQPTPLLVDPPAPVVPPLTVRPSLPVEPPRLVLPRAGSTAAAGGDGRTEVRCEAKGILIFSDQIGVAERLRDSQRDSFEGHRVSFDMQRE